MTQSATKMYYCRASHNLPQIIATFTLKVQCQISLFFSCFSYPAALVTFFRLNTKFFPVALVETSKTKAAPWQLATEHPKECELTNPMMTFLYFQSDTFLSFPKFFFRLSHFSSTTSTQILAAAAKPYSPHLFINFFCFFFCSPFLWLMLLLPFQHFGFSPASPAITKQRHIHTIVVVDVALHSHH